MSEIRLNILDAGRECSGTIHASVADAAIAALSAEPETVEELQEAMARFHKPVDGSPPFEGFEEGMNDEPYDAGIMFLDLAARVVATESTYSEPAARGQVRYHDGKEATEHWLPYCVPADWLFLGSIEEYEGLRDRRRAERAASPPFDARQVLYGAVLEFIVERCLAARYANAEDPIAKIHADWLMTPRDDLRGRSPREVLLSRFDLIDADLWSREHQWSLLDEPPPCLRQDSAAYRFAAFGTHEIVVYYELVRYLITECWDRAVEGGDVSKADEVSRLEELKSTWLECPQDDLGMKTAAYILECERKRLPLVVSPDDTVIDDDCPLCRAMAKQFYPTFSHLDGCNMDDEYPFSFHDTMEDWEAERAEHAKFAAEYERKRTLRE
jgi:hypothetical protein